MTADIYIISGFLGAGKTTLIQKLLKEGFSNKKLALIENDFGEISVDAALLKSSGIEITEINAGCICCSLSGDFVKSLEELLRRFHPEAVIIEPSGVGKLSDVVKACTDVSLQALATVKKKITVVDVKRCKMYLENFGAFFEDQIKHADIVLLSRADVFPQKVQQACALVKEINPHAQIVSQPWDAVDVLDMLHAEHVHDAYTTHGCCCGHHHDGCTCTGQHEHGKHCSCRPSHAAEEVFDTVTIRTERRFSMEELTALVARMERSAPETILRAKGIVRGTDGYMNVQYLPGDVQITNSAAQGDMLCFIGRELNRQQLAHLFGGE